MTGAMPGDMQVLEEISLAVVRKYIDAYFPLYPLIQSSASLHLRAEYVRESIETMCASLHYMLLQGEITDSVREIEHTIKYEVFATWRDHLKYVLNKRRLMGWLPRWFTGRLVPRYMTVSKTVTIRVPVRVSPVCPHHGSDIVRDVSHLRFLYPERKSTG